MIRGFCLSSGQSNPDKSKPIKDKASLDAFTETFKDRFGKFKAQFKYNTISSKIIYCIMKCEGDILMELRGIESAILTYKELVRSSILF